MTRLNLNEFTDFDDNGISRRLLIEDPLTRVLLVSLRAGQGLPAHAADGLVTILALSGRAEFVQGSERAELSAGTLVRIPPGGEHSLKAAEDTRLLVTLVRPGDAAIWNALAPNGQDLDLRQTPRPRRHPTVFYAFDQLKLGEAFFIVNDHDPQPLHWQMDEQRPGELKWEYVQRGPELFRIRVTRIANAGAPVHA